MEIYQHTLQKPVSFRGIGLHTGVPVTLKIKPARSDHGIRFKLAKKSDSMPAVMDRVVDTRLATTIAEKDMVFSTTEHLLAALVGLGIDNAMIELDGPELPIMDGSAGPFVHILKKMKKKRQKNYRRMIKITHEINYVEGDSIVKAVPYDGLRLTCDIEFQHPLIQNQCLTVDISPENFIREIATARTFGFVDQVEKLQASGYALGGSLENAIVIGDDGIINDDGLRFSDEFVRHKVLDLLGDLALLGCPIMGHVFARKAGHSQHLNFMKQLARHPECWQYIEHEERENDAVLERFVGQTKQAGNKILPFLVPEKYVEEGCPATA